MKTHFFIYEGTLVYFLLTDLVNTFSDEGEGNFGKYLEGI